MNKNTIEKIGNMYNEGKSVEEISNITGYSYNTIRTYLSRNGYTKKEFKKKFLEDIKKMYLEYHMTTKEIAEKTNKSASYIRNILCSNNIKRKDENYEKSKQFIVDKYGELYRDGKISSTKISIEIADMNLNFDSCTIIKIMNDNGYKRNKIENKQNDTNKRKTREEYNNDRKKKLEKFYEEIWDERTNQKLTIVEIALKHSKSSGYISACLSRIRKNKIESGEIVVEKKVEEPKNIVTNNYSNKKEKPDTNTISLNNDIKNKKEKIEKPYLELDNNKVFYEGKVYEILKGKKLRRELLKILNVVS